MTGRCPRAFFAPCRCGGNYGMSEAAARAYSWLAEQRSALMSRAYAPPGSILPASSAVPVGPLREVDRGRQPLWPTLAASVRFDARQYLDSRAAVEHPVATG